jgi:alpha-ketoglutarate-dependent taurine dioxygenase
MRKARNVTPSELRHHIREMMVATIGCNPRKIPRRITSVNAEQILETREKNSEAKRMCVIKHPNEDCNKRVEQVPDEKSWVDK